MDAPRPYSVGLSKASETFLLKLNKWTLLYQFIGANDGVEKCADSDVWSFQFCHKRCHVWYRHFFFWRHVWRSTENMLTWQDQLFNFGILAFCKWYEWAEIAEIMQIDVKCQFGTAKMASRGYAGDKYLIRWIWSGFDATFGVVFFWFDFTLFLTPC